MSGPIHVNERLVIPESAIEVQFSRSSGPGGQNVNKVASKVRLWIDLDLIQGLSFDDLERLRAGLAARLDEGGRFQVVSQMTRDQGRNVEDARSKAAEMIRAALRRVKPRRATRPTSGSRERRLDAKRRRSKRLNERRVED